MPTVMSNGAPCATLTRNLAGPGACGSASVRSNCTGSTKGAPGLPSRRNERKAARPVNTPAGRRRRALPSKRRKRRADKPANEPAARSARSLSFRRSSVSLPNAMNVPADSADRRLPSSMRKRTSGVRRNVPRGSSASALSPKSSTSTLASPSRSPCASDDKPLPRSRNWRIPAKSAEVGTSQASPSDSASANAAVRSQTPSSTVTVASPRGTETEASNASTATVNDSRAASMSASSAIGISTSMLVAPAAIVASPVASACSPASALAVLDPLSVRACQRNVVATRRTGSTSTRTRAVPPSRAKASRTVRPCPTTTASDCSAMSPVTSSATTSIVAVPCEAPQTLSRPSRAKAGAIAGCDDTAVYVNASPSTSRNRESKSRSRLSPTSRRRSSKARTASGGLRPQYDGASGSADTCTSQLLAIGVPVSATAAMRTTFCTSPAANTT